MRLKAALAAALMLLPEASLAQTRPAFFQPVDPVHRRQYETERRELTQANGLKDRTLDAIALAVGKKFKGGSYQDLIGRVRSLAVEAGALRRRLPVLEAQISSLSNAALRTPAQAAVTEARVAIDQGRLEDADASLGRLAALRLGEVDEARDAMREAIEDRAKLALLRLDYEAAERIQLEALAAERARDKDSREYQLRLAYGAGEAAMEAGLAGHDTPALHRAVKIMRDDALPLAPRNDQPWYWAAIHGEIGAALGVIGERENDRGSLNASITELRMSLDYFTPERDYPAFLQAMTNLANAFDALARGRGDLRALRDMVEIRRTLVRTLQSSAPTTLRASTTHALAVTLKELAELAKEPTVYAEALVNAEAALNFVSRTDDPLTWAQYRSDICVVQFHIGLDARNTAALTQVIQCYDDVIAMMPREKNPTYWGEANLNLGNALDALGRIQKAKPLIERANEAYRNAVAGISRTYFAQRWAYARAALAANLVYLGRDPVDLAKLREAIALYDEVTPYYTRQADEKRWAINGYFRALARVLVAEKLRDATIMDRGEAEFRELLSANDPATQEMARQRLEQVSGWRMKQVNQPATP